MHVEMEDGVGTPNLCNENLFNKWARGYHDNLKNCNEAGWLRGCMCLKPFGQNPLAGQMPLQSGYWDVGSGSADAGP